MSKKRLDILLTERGFAESRTRARSLIMAGAVFVDGERVDKSGSMTSENSKITLKEKDHPYVSRGGVKLAHALEMFKVDPSGVTCLDVGASTGGFTDCLLQSGAQKVWAVDVGENQLDYRLRTDERVVSLEKVNARDMDISLITDPVALLVADVSFISLRLVIPPLLPLLTYEAKLLLLVKPQFEAGRENVGKNGVVTSLEIHNHVINKLLSFFASIGLSCWGVTDSPISGRKGNREYFMLLERVKEGVCGRILRYDVKKPLSGS